ncbi:MAG TPA: SGNH/GDSL hydrolase family protein [Cytophagales bacterium]|nr:SGNH/GDSL hydrolase family protein [Cytophagales bacterium]
MFSNCAEERENDIYPDSGSSPAPHLPTPYTAYNFLALGDSYTIGESISEDQRWYLQLIDSLKEAGVPIKESDVIAQTGWTTGELTDAIEQSGNQKKYDIVSLLIGVNNQYRGQSIETYKNEFRELLNTAVNFANSKKQHVIVLSIPDWGVTPFGTSNGDPPKIAQEIDEFNEAAKAECAAMGIHFIDITEISRLAKNEPSFVAIDGLHFSGKMYQLWAKEAFPFAKEILGE